VIHRLELSFSFVDRSRERSSPPSLRRVRATECRPASTRRTEPPARSSVFESIRRLWSCVCVNGSTAGDRNERFIEPGRERAPLDDDVVELGTHKTVERKQKMRSGGRRRHRDRGAVNALSRVHPNALHGSRNTGVRPNDRTPAPVRPARVSPRTPQLDAFHERGTGYDALHAEAR